MTTIDDQALTRLRLDVAYDGTGFSGWSDQPGRRTVQGEIEQALVTLFRRLGDVPTVTVAGRTDAGVHARGQVVHLDLTDAQIAQLQRPHRGMVDRSPLDAPTVLARRLNGLAGASDEIVVSGAGSRLPVSTPGSEPSGAATSTASPTGVRSAIPRGAVTRSGTTRGSTST
nr:hypothetical protein GCM10025699_67020 [Microbacterium flavescens]